MKIGTKLARSARPEGARGALRLSDWNYVQTSNQNKEVQTSNQNHFQNKEVQRAGRLRPPLGSYLYRPIDQNNKNNNKNKNKRKNVL